MNDSQDVLIGIFWERMILCDSYTVIYFIFGFFHLFYSPSSEHVFY
jgi:hypothetical protein